MGQDRNRDGSQWHRLSDALRLFWPHETARPSLSDPQASPENNVKKADYYGPRHMRPSLGASQALTIQATEMRGHAASRFINSISARPNCLGFGAGERRSTRVRKQVYVRMSPRCMNDAQPAGRTSGLKRRAMSMALSGARATTTLALLGLCRVTAPEVKDISQAPGERFAEVRSPNKRSSTTKDTAAQGAGT